MEYRKASRQKVKLKIGLSGPSGSGKTKSALRLARGMVDSWEQIAVIDTENGSAELYADLGPYNVVTLSKFDPKSYIEAIQFCEKNGAEVIIIDSITHEWKYCLEMVDNITAQSVKKTSFSSWNTVTPLHNSFIQAILQSSRHIICTVRSKQDYSLDKNDLGKTVVSKLGMKPETRDNFDFELTLFFDISMSHIATASKDRTQLFEGEEIKITEEVGQRLREWAELGIDPIKIDIDPPPPQDKKLDKKAQETRDSTYQNILGLMEKVKSEEDLRKVWKENITTVNQSILGPDLVKDLTERKDSIKTDLAAKAK